MTFLEARHRFLTSRCLPTHEASVCCIVVGCDGLLTRPEEFKADMAKLFDMLRDGAIHPVVIDRLPLAAAREVHTRVDAGGLGGKIVLLPWLA
jgi:NADPH:quinone reductase-like Zn-dependent oxidoreductase